MKVQYTVLHWYCQTVQTENHGHNAQVRKIGTNIVIWFPRDLYQWVGLFPLQDLKILWVTTGIFASHSKTQKLVWISAFLRFCDKQPMVFLYICHTKSINQHKHTHYLPEKSCKVKVSYFPLITITEWSPLLQKQEKLVYTHLYNT